LVARRYFDNQGIKLEQNHCVHIGSGSVKKPHKFDLGSSSPPIIVECKSHLGESLTRFRQSRNLAGRPGKTCRVRR
jgi:hypothetical protein